MSEIPFESPGFSADDLEEFVARFLNAGVSLAVDGPEGVEERQTAAEQINDDAKLVLDVPKGVEERRILRAYRSNKNGGVSDGGVDVVAKVEGGEIWGFQCKLKTRGQAKRWTLGMSRKAVEEVTYSADRYFLVAVATNGYQREAIDYVEEQQAWEFWDTDVLSSQFLSRVSLEEGVRILEGFFGRKAAENCYGLLQDDVLVPAARFFESFCDETRPFNHTIRLVGRQKLIESLHDFVEKSTAKVLLVAARGGEGKSRALREFGLEFEARHPDRVLRFVNPFSSNDSESSLGYMLRKNLVAVHEDAHRVETLRSPILAAVSGDPGAKLILTVRPQGIEAVRGILRDHGIGVADIQALPALSPLSESDMIKLAGAVLGESPPIEPRILAGWSDRSPLVCVVGGNLIRIQRLSPRDIPDSEAFRYEVFERFEQQNLEILSHRDPDRQDLLKKLLRTLATLAPYPSEKKNEGALAKFLDLRGSQLEERLTELTVAELIAKTEKGWRVSPDLFADHLVFTSCVKDGGSSAFCDELIEEFGADHSAAMLRNLSEAEWRSRMHDGQYADLTGKLWRRFREMFEGNSFWDRRGMLESWSAFSVFLPEKSIEFARLAIELDRAPEDDWSPLAYLGSGTHRQVLEMVPNLLKPIGIYHSGQRFEVFDILARLGLGWSPESPVRMREGDNHPWVVIGKAASFALNQPMESIGGVVQWIRNRLETEWFAELADQRCSFFSVVLESVFQRSIERTYGVGMTVTFETIPLSVEKTAPFRNDAFDLIEKDLIPRSEIATHNVIPVLRSAIPIYGVGPDSQVDPAEWRPSRLQAIGLLRKCLDTWKTPFVSFSIWQALAPRIPNMDPAIAEAVKSALDQIPRDLSFSLALVTLGDGSHFRLDQDLEAKTDYQRSWDHWKRFVPEVATELLEEHPEADELRRHLLAFDRDARSRGFVPNWSPLLAAVAQVNAPVGVQWVEQILRGEGVFLESYGGSLIEAISDTADEKKDAWVAAALSGERTDVVSSALRMIQWRSETPGKQTIEALNSLLVSSNETDRKLAVEALGEAVAYGNEWSQRLLSSIPVSDLGDDEFSGLVKNLASAISYRDLSTKLDIFGPVLERMEAVAQIYADPYRDFLQIFSERKPRDTYELVRKRIERFEKLKTEEQRSSFAPVPELLKPWMIPGLEKEADFEAIVKLLIDRVRDLGSKASRYWASLFQAAVLMNPSPLGLAAMREWLSEVKTVDELADIAGVFNPRDSRLVFRYPNFVKELLVRASSFSNKAQKRIQNLLIPDTSGRGFSSGRLTPEYHYVLEEARKAAAAHAGDPVLKPFFDSVIERELRIRQRAMEEYQDRMLAVG